MSTTELRALLGPAAGLADELLATARADRTRLPSLFPGLPRRTGRDPVGDVMSRVGDATLDLVAFRRCDVVAAWLLRELGATDAELLDLYAHGDIEERAMLLRALNFLPLGPITNALLGEVQRTNVVLHLEAALCDCDLLGRAVAAGAVDADAKDKLLLKFAFLDLPLKRALGAETLASVRLSEMLRDLATEREAAGRAVWRDTWRLLGRAPCAGALARLIGGLEHGDDGVRFAAAEGLLALPDRGAGIAGFAKERVAREPRTAITALLQRLADPS
ncbi:MAG: EboA domain-containing protein [Planctomycetes bacterium]|nr:EboA domain-containing protein [Planctomycetota bacterium]